MNGFPGQLVLLRSAAGRILRHRFTVRLRRLLGDGRRIVSGSAAFIKYLLTREVVDLGIAQFSANCAAAMAGRQNGYSVVIANARSEPREVTLRIDIRPADCPPARDGSSTRFSKRLKAADRTSTRVDLSYDWLTAAEFLVGDASSPPDDFRRGTLEAGGRYAVTATLLDSDEEIIERLTVYQELTT